MNDITPERTLTLAKYCERGELTAAECDEVADILRYYVALTNGPQRVVDYRFEDHQ